MTERIVDTQKINNLIKLKPAGDLPGGAAVAPRRLGLGDRVIKRIFSITHAGFRL